MSSDFGDDVSRTSALFAALGLGPIDADDDGCFVMRYDEQTSLHFQIVPGADLLKVAVSVCTLDTSALALRIVLRANLDAPRSELPGALSLVASTRQVLFNTAMPVVVPVNEDAVRAVQPHEFEALLQRVLKEALRWRRRLARDLQNAGEAQSDATSSHLNLDGASHVVRG